MKNILYFILNLVPWFLSGLLFQNNGFYQSLDLPFFALPSYMYGIIWTILYILISISIFIIYKNYGIKNVGNYNKALISNYIFNQLYTYFLFGMQNLFLAFIDTILILITGVILYDETKKLNEKASKFLIPYILFTVFAIILSISVYFMNLP